MSKNFELLREAGWMQEYFDGIEVLPPAAAPGAKAAPRYQAARNDHFAQLVRRVFLNLQNPNIRSVAFSSVSENADAAQACAQTGKTLASLVDSSVCVIDAHLDAPSLHRQFQHENAAGFADSVFQSKPAGLFAQQVDGSNLHFLCAGARQAYQSPGELDLNGPLHELRREFEYTIVLAPRPADAGFPGIARACDGAVLVLQSAGVGVEQITGVRRRLEAVHVSLFGVVLTEQASTVAPIIGRFAS